jgi:hypothetical protein
MRVTCQGALSASALADGATSFRAKARWFRLANHIGE